MNTIFKIIKGLSSSCLQNLSFLCSLRVSFVFILLVVLVLQGFMLGTAKLGQAADTPDTSLDSYDMLKIFGEIINQVNSKYVKDVDETELLEAAIRGMLKNLDPHTSYLDQKTLSDFTRQTNGQFGGIGLEVERNEDGNITVVSPLENTPADKAGIKSGDVLTHVDGTPINTITFENALNRMRGKPNTTVTITVKSGDESKVVNLVRSIIKNKIVYGHIDKYDIAYIRLLTFSSNAAVEINKKLNELKAQVQPVGLILDLRNNPGGLLSEAVNVSDLFLDRGEIVLIRNNRVDEEQKDSRRFQATIGDILNAQPLVVLINKGSASSSEIVAAAMQDHERGFLIGERSYGKGLVQDIIDIGRNIGMPRNQVALKLTTQRYYTPQGESIHKNGITPDLIVLPNDEPPFHKSSQDKYTSSKYSDDTQLSYAIFHIKNQLQ